MGGTAVPASIAAPNDQGPSGYQPPASIAAPTDATPQGPSQQQQAPQQAQPQQSPQAPPAVDPSMGGGSDPAQGADGRAPAAAPHKPGLFSSVLNAVSSALGGPQTVSIARNPETGAIEVTRRDSTSGEKWGRILQSALQGMSAGLSQPSGPGQLSRAAGASIGAGMQGAQQRQQQMRADANQDFDEGQKAQLHAAQMALLGTQNATAAFDLTQKKQQTFDGFVQAQNSMHDLITANSNNRYVGNVPSSADLPELQKTDPNIIQDFYAGKVKILPHVNEDGTYHGLDVYHVEQDWQKQVNRQPVPRTHMVAGKNIGDPPQLVTDMLPANSISNGDYMKLHDADTGAILLAGQKKFEDEQTAAKNRATINKDNAEAGEAGARAGEARAQTSQILSTVPPADASDPNSDFNINVRKLAMGDMKLSELPSRTGKGQITKQQYIAGAERASQQMFGRPYEPEIIHQEASFANNEKTQAYMAATARLATPSAGTQPLLDQLVAAAQAAGLGDNAASNSATIAMATNPITASLQSASHNAAVRNFITVRNEVQRSISTAAGNPLIASSDSDIKLKQMEQTIGSVPTISNLRSEVGSLKTSIAQERATAMANNRFLQRRYGSPTEQQQSRATSSTPPTATPTDALPRGGGKPIDPRTAAIFLQQAGGDKAAARTLAQHYDWTF